MSKLQVLQSTPKSGTSKAGKPYAFQILKCVATLDDGSFEVGEITLFDQAAPVAPGLYSPQFGLKRNQEGRIEGQIVGLLPLTGPKAA